MTNGKRNARITALANQKGGVGKTTTAINLAAAVAGKRRRVLLVDMDPQGNGTSGLGIDRRALDQHLYHCLIGAARVEDCLRPTDWDGLHVLPSGIDLVGVEVELLDAPGREQRLKQILAPLRQGRFDYIFIDCPPSLGLLTINALTAADSVIIPMQCEYFALEGLAQLVPTIRSVKKGLNRYLYVEGLLLTMYDRRNRLTHQVAREIKQHFGEQVYDTVIPRNVRLSESPSHGKHILAYDRRCAGAKAYIKLGREFLARQRRIAG